MSHLPVGKRFTARVAGRENQFRHTLASAMQALEQTLKFVPLPGVPLRRYLRRLLPEDTLGNLLFEAHEPRLEGRQAIDTFVNAVPGVEPAQRRVRKIPLARVKAESEVNHHRHVPRSVPSCITR